MPGIHTMHENIKIRGSVSKTIEKLSSGFRINRAADDAAGLGVSESMRAQITELARAQRNVQEGIDVTNTADGALAEINSMLIRARELCIEGANGIYSQTELDAISDELNEIFDDIDRITEGTNFNDIQLFRFHGSTEVTPLPEVKHQYTYTDHFTPVDPANPVTWGELDFIKQEDPFGDPTPPVLATVSFELENGIDPQDAMTMDGKTINIDGNNSLNSVDFYFTSGKYTFPPSENRIKPVFIPISPGETVQQVLDKLCQANYFRNRVSSAKLEGRTVTFFSKPGLLYETIDVDGKPYTVKVPQGDGTAFSPIISMEGNTIAQVDKDINIPVYSTTTKETLFQFSKPLTKELLDNLNRNSLVIGDPRNPDIKIPLSTLGCQENESPESLIQKLANAINQNGNTSKYRVKATVKDGQLVMQAINLSSNKPTKIFIYEEPASKTPASSHKEYGNSITGKPLSFSFDTTSSVEGSEVTEITIPNLDQIASSGPFSFFTKRSINNAYGPTGYFVYDSSKTPIPTITADYDQIETIPKDLERMHYIDIKDCNGDRAQIAKKIAQLLPNASYAWDATVSVKNDGTIRIESNKRNQSMSLNRLIYGGNVTIRNFKEIVDSPELPASKPVLNINRYFAQEVSVSFNLGTGSPNEIAKLAGSGFSFSPTGYESDRTTKRIEFTNGTSIKDNYTDIDISGYNSAEEICGALQTAMGSLYKVVLDKSNPNNIKLVVTGERSTTDEAAIVNDGYLDKDGIFTNKGDGNLTKTFSGGTKIGYSQTEIDFSSINSDNLDTLLGKGFRITCATCTGEYINVFFCWEKTSDMPASFEIMDNTQNPPQPRTIHNIPVELSKVTDGEKIVESIVSQLSSELKHYTAVEVGEPPTKLIARDRRRGNITDANGNLVLDANGNPVRAKVLSGVVTNFEYSYDKTETDVVISSPDISTPSGDEENKIDFWKMLIYAGSEPDHQWIPIHLPYLDLPTLHLSPPDKVDLGSGEDPFDWLERVDAANDLIITSRTRIGADYNRLEHTYSALTQTRENIEDAESRIRDADMAKLMVQYMKDQIIGQAQQSMMLHSNERPQQILELLK